MLLLRRMTSLIILFDICCVLYCLRMLLSLSTNAGSSDFMHQTRMIQPKAIILTKTPSIKVVKHLNALVRAGVNAFIMCDEDPSNYTNLSSRILYTSNQQLAQYGIRQNLVWDRVLVWLYNQSWIDYIWLIEEDVAWSHARHVVRFFNQYENNSADLLAKSIINRTNITKGWMGWPKAPLRLFPIEKWAGSLNMISRVSRRLILAHQHYTRQLMNLVKLFNRSEIDSNYYYQEFVIPSIVNMFNLTMFVYNASKLYVGVVGLGESDVRFGLAHGLHIFHPVKHDSAHLVNGTL